ncbi:LexA family protein [Turicibacter sanguinis]|uniref:LexA family protein n=2 Tax=Turicibacter sanguinis TaxID=154288 RepID=UPI0006C4D30A|nr:XRE family transcriptional regulator [Turicibacter sanguinis]MDB8573628.1 XRE family transcriptional regulator [Turicibacter sanguinis]MDB8577111.1 XRE family transcriptional regulator [Turicibacter sanguinis]MDB8582458.1 XRE family transcriptional regulator [Turicibacter sanguinis]MDB8585451.1 XRE family transcriptional regulator [Turicibacter sanguinis]MDB8596250.1 XRE family transcriptional regulator [Turicibacter sanguinis]
MFGKNLRYLRLRDNLSQEELAQILGYKSYTTIQKWESGVNEPNMLVLNKLADKWKLTLDELVNVDLESRRYNQNINSMLDATISNNIHLNPINSSQHLIVYGKICAGNGIEALEDPIDEIGDPYYRIKQEKFALLVDGDSMNNVVNDGMYAIVEKTPTVNNGEIAILLIDNEVGMLKRFYRIDDMVILRPDSTNPDHKPLTFVGEEINSLKILGRYLGCVSPMENLL